jgi:hypothetical protein
LPSAQNDTWSGSDSLFNYAKFSVTPTSGEPIDLAIFGGSGDSRGFLNSVQIVNPSTIPEPATYALLGGLASLLVTLGFKHRR